MIVSFICDICKSFHNAVIWDRCFHHCIFTLGLVFVSLDNSPRILIMVLTTNGLLLFSCNIKWMVVTPFIKCDKNKRTLIKKYKETRGIIIVSSKQCVANKAFISSRLIFIESILSQREPVYVDCRFDLSLWFLAYQNQ